MQYYHDNLRGKRKDNGIADDSNAGVTTVVKNEVVSLGILLMGADIFVQISSKIKRKKYTRKTKIIINK